MLFLTFLGYFFMFLCSLTAVPHMCFDTLDKEDTEIQALPYAHADMVFQESLRDFGNVADTPGLCDMHGLLV